MKDTSRKNSNSARPDDSISGLSASHFVSKDDSLASLLLNHHIQVRDFILLSFLSDQGPMSVSRLARAVGLEPQKTLLGLQRLSAANLLIREPAAGSDEFDSMARLTSRGEEIAARVSNQMT